MAETKKTKTAKTEEPEVKEAPKSTRAKKKAAKTEKMNLLGAAMFKPFIVIILVFVIIGLGFWIATMVRNMKTDIFEEKLAQMQSVTLVGEGETLNDAVKNADSKALANFGDCYQISLEEITEDPWVIKVTYRRNQ